MATPLNILLVEDSEDDAELVLLQLRRGGYQPDAVRVDTAQDMRTSLQSRRWDIIIADFSMPRFSGLAALRIAREFDRNLPLILVSGTVGEEVAVQAMKAGATDYIMKSNLTRLVPAIERELREAEHRRERLRVEDALFHERERALVTLHSIGDGVITTDAKAHVEYLNPIAEQLTGWSVAEARGRPLMEVFPVINEATRKPIQNPADICLHTGCVVTIDEQSVLVSRSGQEFPVEDSAAPIRDRGGKILGTVLVFHDVSAQRHLTHKMAWNDSHDTLTGLVNRCEFELQLQNCLATTRDSNPRLVLLYLDLDQFKVVNDTCGHVAGDQMLKQLADTFLKILPESSVLARLGGDEFGVLLQQHDVAAGREVADRLQQAARDFRFRWENNTFEIGASIGLVAIDNRNITHSVAMSSADVACYVAKDLGRNRVHVYQEGDIEQARRHGEMQWVNRINSALQDGRFVLYRQPIISLQAAHSNGRHHELLVRMLDTNGELIPPGAFIPAAERYNLMPALDRWVVDTACKFYGGNGRDLRGICSVNLSGNSLNDDTMLDFLRSRVTESKVSPDTICFEITETAAIANLAKASEFIRELRGLGCRFALDDFGSGLSSFAYLKTLAVDYLKIDGNFVRDMVNDPIDHAIVESINQIGHVMGMETIAEFAENAAIVDELKHLGVDYAQGYGIGYPEPLEPK